MVSISDEFGADARVITSMQYAKKVCVLASDFLCVSLKRWN